MQSSLSFTLRVLIITLCSLCFTQVFAQVQKAPGGVSGASLWSADGDSADFLANYRSLNLLDLKVQADMVIPPLQGATTLFLALKPNFTTAAGNEFFELGILRSTTTSWSTVVTLRRWISVMETRRF